MRVIKVYGTLAKFLGQRSFKAAVKTPAEAIRFLVANFPGIKEHMAEKFYKVSVDKSDLQIADHPEQLHFPTLQSEVIKIVPVVGGAKRGGLGQILAGIGLIAISFLLPGAGIFGTTSIFGVTAAQGGAVLAGLGSAISAVGASLVLGGVSQLITPAPKMMSDQTDPSRSYSFSGIQNVSRQGVAVPVVYGEMLVGSVVISAGVNADDV